MTGTGKTRATMNLAIEAEKAGLCLRILDVEGEWNRIILAASCRGLRGDSLRRALQGLPFTGRVSGY